jgi:hypothetical protein
MRLASPYKQTYVYQAVKIFEVPHGKMTPLNPEAIGNVTVLRKAIRLRSEEGDRLRSCCGQSFEDRSQTEVGTNRKLAFLYPNVNGTLYNFLAMARKAEAASEASAF